MRSRTLKKVINGTSLNLLHYISLYFKSLPNLSHNVESLPNLSKNVESLPNLSQKPCLNFIIIWGILTLLLVKNHSKRENSLEISLYGPKSLYKDQTLLKPKPQGSRLKSRCLTAASKPQPVKPLPPNRNHHTRALHPNSPPVLPDEPACGTSSERSPLPFRSTSATKPHFRPEAVKTRITLLASNFPSFSRFSTPTSF